MLHLCCQGLTPWSSWTTQTHPSAGCGLAPSGHTCSLEFNDQLGQMRILRWMGPSGLNSGDGNVSVSWGNWAGRVRGLGKSAVCLPAPPEEGWPVRRKDSRSGRMWECELGGSHGLRGLSRGFIYEASLLPPSEWIHWSDSHRITLFQLFWLRDRQVSRQNLVS